MMGNDFEWTEYQTDDNDSHKNTKATTTRQ
jgi:hypothetical protein